MDVVWSDGDFVSESTVAARVGAAVSVADGVEWEGGADTALF